MRDTTKSSRTFYSQWGPPTLLGGLFVVLGFSAFIIAALKPGFSGFSDLFQHGAGYAFLTLIALGIIFWLCFFCRVRFEKNHATIYYCGCFPVRINYADVIHLAYSYGKYKKQEVPAAIHFYLRSGGIKSWNINLFSQQTAQAIKAEWEERISIPTTRQEIPDIQLWVNHILRPSLAVKIIYAVAAIICLGLGIWGMKEQLAWDDRIETWDKVDGIILKNTTKRVSSRGKGTKEVADVEYQYTYKGATYHGTKIVYDSDSFPDLKVGTKRQVIVDPENPQNCAIMFWYRGKWGLLRWMDCAVLYVLALLFSGMFLRTLFTKKRVVPERLKNYMNTLPAEQFHAALKMERRAMLYNRVELRQKMEYLQSSRFGVIRENVSKTAVVLLGIWLLLTVTATIFIPACWILVVISGLLVFSLYKPHVTVFDFQEKKILSGSRFHPEKLEHMEVLPFSEVDHLSCERVWRKNGYQIGIFAVKRDGTKIPVCKASPRHLELLLELLPELAEKMGHLPITY